MQEQITQAVLLVGGQATRLRPLTECRPKALVPLLNEPLLTHEFKLLAAHGIRDIILAVGYQADILQNVLGDGSRWGVKLSYVQDPEPSGTAGAIRNAAHLINGPFVVMNGDLVYDVDVSAAIEDHLTSEAMMTFVLRQVEDISRYGLILCDEAGWVTEFREKQIFDPTGRNTVNSGLYIMNPEVLDFIPAQGPYSNENQLFPGLLNAQKPLRGHVPNDQGYWADVGTLDGYLQTSAALLTGAVSWCGSENPKNLPDSIFCSQKVLLGQDIKIGENVCIGENVVAGRGVVIDDDCTLQNCILWDNVVIGTGVAMKDTICANNVTIGPECAIKNGVIGSDTVLDAECALKDSTIGVQCKINSFSAINRSKIGNRATVEANCALNNAQIDDDTQMSAESSISGDVQK